MVSQWRSSVNLHIWNTLKHHWKTTGSTLERHWLPAILNPVALQCALGSKFQAHWIDTGLPLNYHWLRVRVLNGMRHPCLATRHSHQARDMTFNRLGVNYQCPGLYPGLRMRPQCNVPAPTNPLSFEPGLIIHVHSESRARALADSAKGQSKSR